MSTQPGFAGSESDPEIDDQPTAVQEPTTAQWSPPAAPVAPPPDLETAGNVKGGLITSTASDRCTNCGGQLAPDQHYCVVCGERRGRARFAGAMFGPQAVAQSAPAAAPAGSTQRSGRFPPAATLIAGVATLLVAMGLGILIGHDSNGAKTLAPQPKVDVTVNGGGGSGSGASTGASTTANSTSKSSAKATKSSTKAVPKVSTAQAQKSQAAASKVLGASSAKTAPPTAQVGQACAHGAGCQGGKFTGTFFGG